MVGITVLAVNFEICGIVTALDERYPKTMEK
jgi:hypothetical protein